MNLYCRGCSSRKNYCRDNIPRGDHEKKSKIDLAKQDPKKLYLENFNISTVSLTLRRRSHHRRKNRRLIIVDDAIFIDMETNKK
jgi:hypothetical protein